eukprot:6196451-Pleurochrysis_carterae.AAC.3
MLYTFRVRVKVLIASHDGTEVKVFMYARQDLGFTLYVLPGTTEADHGGGADEDGLICDLKRATSTLASTKPARSRRHECKLFDCFGQAVTFSTLRASNCVIAFQMPPKEGR